MRIQIGLLTLGAWVCGLPGGAQSLTVSRLSVQHVTAENVSYQGRHAVRISDADETGGDVSRLAVVDTAPFENGTIEVDLAGDTLPNAAVTLRGFVGIAFRVIGGGSQYECIYLRPKNGRSEDQLQRNHSVQYISVPGFPWEKVRAESPGKYESYVDLVPGRWTHVRIKVLKASARLYVDGSEQPVLIVNDLKQTVTGGAIALWVGPGTVAHFADLKATP